MLSSPPMVPLPVPQIQPQGWLQRQLEIQADGLSGHLDKIWPSIRDSSWIGGPVEDWERVPYWLDGYIPLAFLLGRDDMKATAKKYIDGILAQQRQNGWFCPCPPEGRAKYDIWPAFLLCKVLVLYHQCTQDERMEQAVYDILRQVDEHVGRYLLNNWAASRWYECLYAIWWLYRRRPEPWLPQLARLLEAAGLDYRVIYGADPIAPPARPRFWTQAHHVVSTAMALKSRALMSPLTGEDPGAFARAMYAAVMRDNSMPTGHFTGDECLGGDAANRGTECCGVVEAMFSYETLLALTGDAYWGDLLERLAFNALPATLSPDMWTHQYVQLTNQVQCTVQQDDEVPFNSNRGAAHTFGLEPNYGCCTANFNQGWPKLACAAVMATKTGLAVATPLPLAAEFAPEGVPVRVEILSEYPFRDAFTIRVTAARAVSFPLDIRIPGFAAGATVDGRPAPCGAFYRLARRWEGETEVRVDYTFEPELTPRPSGMYVLNRGPLLFSVPIGERWEKREYTRDGVERKAPYCDYDITPTTEWGYAFAEKGGFALREAPLPDIPFSSAAPPLRIAAAVYPIAWGQTGGFCNPAPDSAAPTGPLRTVELQPYGATNLRITEIPLIG